MNNKIDLKLFKNKRLHFVLAVLWLIASFLIIKNYVYEIAYDKREFDIALCKFKFLNSTSEEQKCIADAYNLFFESNEVTTQNFFEFCAEGVLNFV